MLSLQLNLLSVLDRKFAIL